MLGSCTAARTLLKQAPTDLPRGWTQPTYTLLPEPLAWQRLEERLYGPLALQPAVEVLSRSVIDDAALSGTAHLIQWRLRIGYGAVQRDIDLVALLPLNRADAPVIISQNFCPNNNVVPLEGVSAPSATGFDCSGGGFMGGVMTQIFGRYIVKPPLELIIERGYGFAALYPSQFVPDNAQAGLRTLSDLFPDDAERPGALSVWASLFDVAAETIEADGPDRTMIAYGHSRFGKTALLAGAVSDRIDMVIAHQSGTLGASTLNDGTGESLKAMVDAYPHWAGPGASHYVEDLTSLGVTPADLLARLFDKPVLLGNARRDVWSDPWGAFKEAKVAWGAHFPAASPSDFRPKDGKAYWLRPGTHGVVKEDWPAFLDFIDAQLSDPGQRPG
ncbi:hypothetical protein GCM10007854_00680 [Algimonas porphyrae]|uniref:4-O-methyl-glucuronoyl methylesterase-like domain-containing protein n=3 Tax=Algimonas porphyrae TaxID=1128113 RepID=A0ABQ5UV40_9PROT|nr:hypothetical protein GCM10007854_00680 [Algimonas porphyrae]